MLASARLSLEPGSTFGPYRIEAPLGRGGMAVVVRAHDPVLDRDVALKVLPPELLHDPTFADRFRQEARVAARLEHPHILPIHAYGIEQGRPWMAMRLVAGGSLADRLRLGPLAPAAAATVLAEVASALDYAHAHGVVHRDVKPANVLLDDAGHAYLADFGIARLAEGSAVVTATGVVQGTPAYMAPEQALGSRVDGRADVYALGIVAFECLTGRQPYTGSTPLAILMKHVSEPVPEPLAAEVAAPLTPVLRRCLAKDPAERWPTAGSFARALTAASSAVPAAAATPTELPTLSFTDGAATGATTAAGPGTGRWVAAGAALALLLVLAGTWVAGRLLGPTLGLPGSAPASASPAAAAAAATATATAVVQPPVTVTVASPPPPRLPTPPPAADDATPAPPPAAAARPSPRPRAGAEAGVRQAPPSSATALRVPPDGAPAPGGDAAAVAAVPQTSPYDLAARYRGERGAPARLRVYCEPSLEPALFRNTQAKDVGDSAQDLRNALAKRGQVEVVTSRAQADAVVQVLERGREPARIGMRKVRLRVSMAGESVELVGQDSAASFNTWSGAAGGAARQVEAWLARRAPAQRP